MMKTRNTSGKCILGCGLALGLFAPFAAAQASGTETVLYSFTGSTGQDPLAGLIDSKGSFHGTTESGGASSYGTVFRLDSNGTETVLLSFDYSDGARPNAGPISDKAGNLYGTTQQGGANSYGVVFKLAPDGTETVLHAFAGQPGSDGAYPVAALISDRHGNFYGTTQHGGTSDNGTVFELAKNGTETVLHDFAGSDGQYPVAGLLRDGSGNLYGTTKQGGAHGSGTVFKVASDGTETVLYSFGGGGDGAFPMCGVIMDKKANLYGTANGGGAKGAGAVFELSAKGVESVLYSFAGGSDGAFPQAGLFRDTAGDLYGTTSSGGASNDGTVFAVKP